MDEKLRRHGAFSWFELMTKDVPAARAFYAEVFGWEYGDHAMGDGPSYTLIKVGGEDVGGMMAPPPPAEGMPPMWGVYVAVTDVDATARRAQERGGRVLVPPQDIPQVGRFCVLQDPQGAVISAITYVGG